MQRIRYRGVLPCLGGELNGEVVLVQYAGAEHATPLSDQLKQLVELHRAAEVAMKDFKSVCGLVSPCPPATSA